ELRLLRGRLFLAPQVPPLPPRQRVVTSVLAGRLPAMSLAASLRSLFYPADIPAAYEALSHFDLSDKLFDSVDRLSGGERQRVGLAR
ncbi:MAG: phosphonate ABC transporter, partial [Limnohabitans sp.]